MGDAKLNQIDESELKLYKQISLFKNNRQKEKSSESSRQKFNPSSNTNDSYLNYLQSKLDQLMIVKITSEEEKYVYLIRKLAEYQGLVS